MRPNVKRTYYFHAHANSLGGFIDKPRAMHVPPQASGSLPPVGGHIATHTEALHFEGILSCRCAYTRISAVQADEHGGHGSVLVTSVVEGLNILEVVTADKIVAQVSIHTGDKEGDPHRISFAGSSYKGLLIDGHEPGVDLNRSLRGLGPKPGDPAVVVTHPLFHETGKQQTAKLVGGISPSDQVEFQWLKDRYHWMQTHVPNTDQPALCSLVDGFKKEMPARSFGHVVEIPDFGRLFLGEMVVSAGVIQLAMIRAELGCNTSGGVTAAVANIGVHTIPP